MARYRVTERSFIDGRIVEAGAEVEYAGEASENLILIEADEAVKAAVKQARGKKPAAQDDTDTASGDLI